MASGFFNTIRQSLKEKWEHPLETYIVVHDSSTSAFPVSKIFEMRPFLDKYYTDYCASIGPKIKLLFDLLQGNDYENAAGVTLKSSNILEFKGSAMTLLPIYDKITRCKDYKVKCSMTRDQLIPNMITSPMARFIDQNGTCIVLDKSKYTIQFEKID